jgi:diaminopimelate epimerase
MRFAKAHGTGNDFIVIPDWDGQLDLSGDLVRALCDRRAGLGADGVLRVVRGDQGADATMDHRNADGSRSEMCGNGIRVVAKHVLDHGLIPPPPDDVVRIATPAGLKEVVVRRDDDGRVVEATVDMGPPVFDPALVPFVADGPEAVGVPVGVGAETVEVTAVSMGNPHAVVVVGDVGSAPVETLGPALERHERFPQRANVEFLEVVDRRRARVRVWERGVGETAACGTGACAALVAGQRLGLLDDSAALLFPGGEVGVRHSPDAHRSVFLSGAAVEVAAGVVHPDWVRQHGMTPEPAGVSPEGTGDTW